MGRNDPRNETTIIYGPRGEILNAPTVMTNQPTSMLVRMWRLLTRS